MTQLVCLYFVYRPKKHTSRTDLMNYDQNAYTLVLTQEMDLLIYIVIWYQLLCVSTLMHLKVYWWIKKVTEMGLFDEYLDYAPCAKTIMVNSITAFFWTLRNVSLSINKICYSNTYLRGKVEVVLFKVRFQGY